MGSAAGLADQTGQTGDQRASGDCGRNADVACRIRPSARPCSAPLVLRADRPAAADAGGEVHDRMTVFLPSDLWDTGLDHRPLKTEDKPAMLDMLGQSCRDISPHMVTYPVSPQVNRAGAGVSDPETIEPVYSS